MEYPHFIVDKEFIRMDNSVSETEQLRAMLDNLTRVHLLTAKKFNSFDELIREYLQCGIEVFGLETGIVSHIDENHIYHVMDVISPLDVLEKGQEFPLADTYCKEVVKTEKVLGFPEVGKLKFMECHPVYVNLKLEAYLSAPIYVDEKLYGTLNFTSVNNRSVGFSENEQNLITLLANSIGNFILLRDKENRLIELNDKMRRFVGYVAHDLRNPIGGIIGLSKLSESHIDNQPMLKTLLPKITETAEETLELVSKVLDMAALSTGKLTIDLKSVPIEHIIKRALHSINDLALHVGVQVKTEVNTQANVLSDPTRILQVIVNLLINALKYGEKQSIVELRVNVLGNVCQIKVSNAVASDTTQTNALPAIYNSVGFGLDIVESILNAHNSKLEVKEDDGQFTSCFSLPLD